MLNVNSKIVNEEDFVKVFNILKLYNPEEVFQYQ